MLKGLCILSHLTCYNKLFLHGKGGWIKVAANFAHLREDSSGASEY